MPFFRDLNSDGKVTITDMWIEIKGLWLPLKELFFMPGNMAVEGSIDSQVGVFFEFSVADCNGLFAGFTSIFLWVGVLAILSATAGQRTRKDLLHELNANKHKLRK